MCGISLFRVDFKSDLAVIGTGRTAISDNVVLDGTTFPGRQIKGSIVFKGNFEVFRDISHRQNDIVQIEASGVADRERTAFLLTVYHIPNDIIAVIEFQPGHPDHSSGIFKSVQSACRNGISSCTADSSWDNTERISSLFIGNSVINFAVSAVLDFYLNLPVGNQCPVAAYSLTADHNGIICEIDFRRINFSGNGKVQLDIKGA